MHLADFPLTMMKRDVRGLVYACSPALRREKRAYVKRNLAYWASKSGVIELLDDIDAS